MLWGITYFFRKTILGDISPFLLSFLSLLISGVGLALLLRSSPRRLVAEFLQAPWLLLFLAGLGSIAQCSMYYGLDHGSLAVTLLLERTQPLFALVLAAMLLKEHIEPHHRIFVALALISSCFVMVDSPAALILSGVSAVGACAVLLASLCWASATIVGRAVMRRGTFRSQDVTILRLLLGAISLLPLVLIRGELAIIPSLSPYVLSVTALTAILGTGCGYLLYMHGLKVVDGAKAGLLEFLMPLTGILLGMLFLDERLTVTQCAAALLLTYSLLKISNR